jgi:cytosine/adenosine deaminase-related metal-dependent hydrolase
MPLFTQALHLRGAHVWNGDTTVNRDIYIENGRFVDHLPNHAQTIDLQGHTIFPALVNAHDHLELNHYPRSKFRAVYGNAHHWGEDMSTRLYNEPFASLRQYPLRDQLFIGGLKNLLCGATTVIHHNPPHKFLWHRDYPVRVLRSYQWSHSLHFSSPTEIQSAYHQAHIDHPWFIHLAEGTDDIARQEFDQLLGMRCIGRQAVFIHCVGLQMPQIEAALAHDWRTLVWCPSTNRYLLGNTLNAQSLTESGVRLLLGSDSRLTADGDLLDELRCAIQCWQNPTALLKGVFFDPTTVCYAENRYIPLQSGTSADFIITQSTADDASNLCQMTRSELALVVRNGQAQIGNSDLMKHLGTDRCLDAKLDGKAKAIHRSLAERIQGCRLKEPGLEVEPIPKKRWFSFH